MKKHLIKPPIALIILTISIAFLFNINLLQLLHLQNLDLILLAIFFYRGKKISILYIILYAIVVKDLIFTHKFTGAATLQYIVVYLLFAKTRNMYIQQPFCSMWIHFIAIVSIYMLIPILLFYVDTGIVMFALSIKLFLATVLWYPIIQNIFKPAKGITNTRFRQI